MRRFKENPECKLQGAVLISICSAVFVFLAGLMLGSCTDDDLANSNGGDKGTTVTFNVSDAQNDAARAAAKIAPFDGTITSADFAKGLAMQALTPEDLTTQKFAVNGGTGANDLCIIETTTAGVSPVKEERGQTRANITTMATLGNFSTIGYRGTTEVGISNTPWFYDKDTNPDGTLVNPIYWSWEKPYGKFFAIFPREQNANGKLKLSGETYIGTPYIDLEVEKDVKNQKDLMTACSGVVHYATQFVAPDINLRFRHALTAVRFKVGQNLSYNKIITKVEIIGAMSKGRYTLSTQTDGTGAAWSDLSTPQTFTLGGDGTVNVSTSTAVNNIILGNNGDNYTFYMIPQSLAGVQVKVHFSDGSTPITANLSGTWKPGTTKTYALSQNTSTWDYQLTVTSPAAVGYDVTTTGDYTVKSYREDPVTHIQQPVKWKVVSYQESTDGGQTWGAETTVKPAWLTSLSMTEGNGGTSAESGFGTLTTNITDLLTKRNKALKNATALGSSGTPYDLSTKGGTIQRSTANCYVISAPGHYRIPLVYGNAIKNGTTNVHAVQTSNTGSHILKHFKNHNNQNITRPWITESNGGVNSPNGAKIVWADESGLVTNLAVSGSGTNAFVKFKVPASAIKNGNAVIAVTKAGVVVWSWHLWFAPQSVLQTTACTNFQKKVYNIPNETLGWKYTVWKASTYSAPRSVKVKVEQTVANGGVKQEGIITITQNNGGVRQGYSTLYQFGRKDAFPGTDAISEGSFNKNGGNNMSIQNGIRHPEIFYTEGLSWINNYSYNNLWSMDNTGYGHNDNPVVKTIYDPCPAGFHMAAGYAFTGFTTTGNNSENQSEFNVYGNWDYGWNFNNKITSPNATVYFPASGYRGHDGTLHSVGNFGDYWLAVPGDTQRGCDLYFGLNKIGPRGFDGRSWGFSVRPVAK